MKQGYRYLSTVFLQDTLRIHYDDLGLYKELLHLIEAKAWKMNELVILTIHLVKVTKDVIGVLAIDILSLFFNRCSNHVLEIKTSILRKMADSNLVDPLVGFHSRLKRDYDSKTRKERTGTPRIILLMLRAFSHLLRCSTIGTFASHRKDLLFQVVG